MWDAQVAEHSHDARAGVPRSWVRSPRGRDEFPIVALTTSCACSIQTGRPSFLTQRSTSDALCCPESSAHEG